MPLRVLHWYPNFLGGGAVAGAVAALADAQLRAGADPLIAAAATDGRSLYGSFDQVAELVRPWQPGRTVSGAGFVLREIRPAVRRMLRDLRPDVVHIHGEFNPDNCWVPQLYSCPRVLSPQGAFNPIVLQKGRRHLKRAYVAAARHLLYRRLTAFHALSPFEADHIAQLVPGASIYCVPQGPSPFLTSAPLSQSPPLPSSEASVDVITIGRLDVFTKGLDVLIEAFAVASANQPRLGSLILVGPDWNGGRAQLERQLKSLGVETRVRFAGRVDGSSVDRFLASADVYVQASRHEGFSLAVAEALVAGKPVIMTRENGAAAFDEITSLPHVRVVDPGVGDLAEALADFALRIDSIREASVAARPALVELLSWDRIARAHLDAYKAL